MELARTVSKLVAPIRRRMALMVGRCVLLAVNDEPGVQQLQIRALEGEVLDRVERHQEYGFTSRPNPGAEGIVVAVGGLRGHSIVIAVEDRRYRLTGLAAGEVALHDDQGQAVHLKRDGIELRTTRPNGVRISAPKVDVSATTACVTAGSIDLGDGDLRPVARVGDTVMINTGSSAGLNGVIHSGSTVTRSA